MSVKGLRKLLWVANTLLVLGIVAYALFFFILGGVRKEGTRMPEKLLTKRNLPEAAPDVTTDKVLPFDTYQVVYQIVIDGEPPVEEGPVDPLEKDAPVPPLAQDYDLLWVAVSIDDPLGSYAHLEYKKDKKTAITVQVGEFVEFVRTGSHVNGDWKLVLVSAIPSPWRAEFVQDGTGEQVTLEQVREDPGELENGPLVDPKEIGDAAGPGVSLPKKQPRERPTRELVEIRENEFNVPPEEQEWWGAYGEDELTSKVALEPAKVDGKSIGLMFKSVEKKSMMERRGVKSGDILKSINGKPVRTRQGIVNYLNKEGKGLKRYEVIIERNGKDIKKVYHVKPK